MGLSCCCHQDEVAAPIAAGPMVTHDFYAGGWIQRGLGPARETAPAGGGCSIVRDETDRRWKTARGQPTLAPVSQDQLAWLDLPRRSALVGMRARRRRKEAVCR